MRQGRVVATISRKTVTGRWTTESYASSRDTGYRFVRRETPSETANRELLEKAVALLAMVLRGRNGS
jgi:hypothetical protein